MLSTNMLDWQLDKRLHPLKGPPALEGNLVLEQYIWGDASSCRLSWTLPSGPCENFQSWSKFAKESFFFSEVCACKFLKKFNYKLHLTLWLTTVLAQVFWILTKIYDFHDNFEFTFYQTNLTNKSSSINSLISNHRIFGNLIPSRLNSERLWVDAK